MSAQPPPYYPPPQPPVNNNSPSGGHAFIVGFLLVALIAGNYYFGWKLPFLPSFESSPPAAEQVAPPPQPAPAVPVEEVVPSSMRACNTNWNPGSNKACKLAKNYASKKVTDPAQLKCLDLLWIGESGWDAWAVGQPTSKGRAQGIPQALGHGHVFDLGDWQKQVDWGLAYIGGAYQTPCNAWDLWQRRSPHWY